MAKQTMPAHVQMGGTYRQVKYLTANGRFACIYVPYEHNVHMFPA